RRLRTRVLELCIDLVMHRIHLKANPHYQHLLRTTKRIDLSRYNGMRRYHRQKTGRFT
ncbi:hypothetical protein L917_10772, partial [Phytophthora nicotianae]